MSKSPNIVEILKEVVERTSSKMLGHLQTVDPTIEGVFFLHGHYTEVKQRLSDKSSSNEFKFKKYPLVVLFHDFPVRRSENNDMFGTASVQMIILHQTSKQAYIDQRYESVFLPILNPIYDEFIYQLKRHKGLMSPGEHTLIDRPHWGNPDLYGSSGYIFKDVLDGKELKDLVLPVRKKVC
jgi:hypothetical protein